jgi:hypothetical protein
METLLLIVGIVFIVLMLLRSAPRSQVIYVPIEVTEEHSGGLGCLPLIVVGIMVLVALGVIRL